MNDEITTESASFASHYKTRCFFLSLHKSEESVQISMSNQEKQADEIVALQAILETKFRFLQDPTQYAILIDFDLVQPFYLRYNGETAMIHSLHPFSLIIHCHNGYPSESPPSFLLSCFYFSQTSLEQLCRKLDRYPFI